MKFTQKAIAVIMAVLVMLSSLSLTVSAKTTDKTTPSGLDYDQIEMAVENFVAEHSDTTKAMSMAVYDDDGVIYKNNFGHTDTNKTLAVDDNTVFEWGSVSKLMIWISAMQLQEQGKLDLNEDVQVYLPEGFLRNLTYDKKITMTDLMNHQAGFQETYFIMTTDENEITTLEEELKNNQPKQVYEPGTVTAYSNWGAALAALIVEKVSGTDYADYITENILEPLDMKHTAVSITLEDNIWVKEQRDKLSCYDAMGNELPNKGKTFVKHYPAGSITGTMDDFIKFAQAITPNENKPCPLFKNQEIFKEMLTPTSYYGDSGVANFHHGFMSSKYEVETIGHGGNTIGCSSMLLFEPESGIGMVVMTNQAGEMVYNYDMYELIFGKFADSELAEIKRELPQGFISVSRAVKEGPISVFSAMGLGFFTEKDMESWWYQEGDHIYLGVYDCFVSTGESIANLVIMMLFIIGGIYALVTLVVGGLIVSPIQRKLRKRKGIEVKHPFRKWNYLTSGTMVVLFADVVMILVRLIVGSLSGNMGTPASYAIHSVIAIVAAIALIIMLVYTLISFVKKSIIDKKAEKAKYIVTGIFAVMMLVAVFVFDIYQFWAI